MDLIQKYSGVVEQEEKYFHWTSDGLIEQIYRWMRIWINSGIRYYLLWNIGYSFGLVE